MAEPIASAHSHVVLASADSQAFASLRRQADCPFGPLSDGKGTAAPYSAARFAAAYRPNTISRVSSGCSSSPNFANPSRISTRHRRASPSLREADDESSAKRTRITSPRPCRRLHQSTHRSRT